MFFGSADDAASTTLQIDSKQGNTSKTYTLKRSMHETCKMGLGDCARKKQTRDNPKTAQMRQRHPEDSHEDAKTAPNAPKAYQGTCKADTWPSKLGVVKSLKSGAVSVQTFTHVQIKN